MHAKLERHKFFKLFRFDVGQEIAESKKRRRFRWAGLGAPLEKGTDDERIRMREVRTGVFHPSNAVIVFHGPDLHSLRPGALAHQTEQQKP